MTPKTFPPHLFVGRSGYNKELMIWYARTLKEFNSDFEFICMQEHEALLRQACAEALNEIDLTTIPDGSLVIFRTSHPRQLAGSSISREIKKRNLFCPILPHEVDIQIMTDDKLKELGLQRIKAAALRKASEGE